MTRTPLKRAILLDGRLQQEIAVAVDVTPATLSMLVTGRLAAWPSVRTRLATELGRAQRDLFPDVEAEVA